MAEKRITVVGAGVSGKALAVWARKQGESVFVTDCATVLSAQTKDTLKHYGIPWEAGGHTLKCCDCDLMLVSSGVSYNAQPVAWALKRSIPVQGELDYLASDLHGKILAVTGTNGKTTCTALAAHVMRGMGLNVCAAGNIGMPLAECAGKSFDALALELSSFQLHWNHALKPHVALLTNLAPDHLDWHGSYENYVQDKCKIFIPRTDSKCYAVVQPCDRHWVPSGRTVCALDEMSHNENSSDEWRIHLTEERAMLVGPKGALTLPLFDKKFLALCGHHNEENAAMSLAAVRLLVNTNTESSFFQKDNDFNEMLSGFKAAKHRCELIGTRHGVRWIDDSKGTNVAATVTALNGLEGKKVVILGGQGKGESYEALASAVMHQARAVIVMGTEAPLIMTALDHAGYRAIHAVSGMEEAVIQADTLAQAGDVVLLSPACTSWDRYRNYNERGDHFAELFKHLI